MAAKSETASVTAWTAVIEWPLSSSTSLAMIGLAWSANSLPILKKKKTEILYKQFISVKYEKNPNIENLFYSENIFGISVKFQIDKLS